MRIAGLFHVDLAVLRVDLCIYPLLTLGTDADGFLNELFDRLTTLFVLPVELASQEDGKQGKDAHPQARQEIKV